MALDHNKGVWKSAKGKGRRTPKGRQFEDEALDENIDLEDTMTLLKEYVDVVETDLDKQRIKNLLQTLYIKKIENTIFFLGALHP